MPTLKSVEFGFNRFCGPSVLSILTGRSTDDCAKIISQVNGSYDVRGVWTKDLLEAAKRMGFKNEDMNLRNSSLFRALHSIARIDGLYIVTLTGHFVCIEVANGKVFFCDNHTKEPIPAASSARLSMNVESVHKVEKDLDWKEPEIPVKKEKLQYRHIVMLECPECLGRGLFEDTVIHEPSCKWRGQD